MAVATRVISDPAVAAVFTTLDMAAEGGRTALLDGRHHLELIEAHMPGIGLAPSGAMVMKDVRDLQPRAAHRRRTNPPVLVPRRMGVRGGRAGCSRFGSWCWRHGCKAPSYRAWRGRAEPG